MPNYAQEYSPANIQSLLTSYGELLEPEAERSRRRLAQALAGTPQMFGSARRAGLGEIEAARLNQIGQYGQRLSEAGLEAGRGERLTAEERAYQESPTSQFSRQLAQQGTQFGQTLAEQQAGRAQQGTQFGQTLTEQQAQRAQQLALQTRAYDLQAQGMTLDEAFRRAQLEQQESQFGQNLGFQREQLAQQGNQFGQNLALQTRAQELQRQGMTLDEAFRRAQIEQQGGQFQQTFGLQSQQAADALANSLLNRQWYPSQFTGLTPTGEKTQATREWETQQTGLLGGQKTLATQLAEAALTGKYGGVPTSQYIQSLLPYVAAGNIPASQIGLPGLKTTQELDPAYQFAAKLGYDPYYLSLLAQTDPDKLKEILKGFQYSLPPQIPVRAGQVRAF